MKRRLCDRCDKTYASSQSLWNHKQRCKFLKHSDVTPKRRGNSGVKSPDRTVGQLVNSEIEDTPTEDKPVVQSVDLKQFEQLVKSDKEELTNLLEEFTVEEDISDLEEKLHNFYNDFEDKSTLPEVYHQLNILDTSGIPKYKLVKFKLLVDNINKKRNIIKMLGNGDMDFRRLQEVISMKEYDKLRNLVNPNMDKVIATLSLDRTLEL